MQLHKSFPRSSTSDSDGVALASFPVHKSIDPLKLCENHGWAWPESPPDDGCYLAVGHQGFDTGRSDSLLTPMRRRVSTINWTRLWRKPGQANCFGKGFASNGTVIIDGCGFPECWTTHVGLGSRSWLAGQPPNRIRVWYHSKWYPCIGRHAAFGTPPDSCAINKQGETNML
ncbi:MAG: hypothetical protein OXC02_03015 [Rhodobacteraceae bacterium]|nr:hypothetical protein [Paracoccaceae bacterium]